MKAAFKSFWFSTANLHPYNEDKDASPRKYATYLATRPRKWEQVRVVRVVRRVCER